MLEKLIVIYIGLLIPVWYFFKTLKLLVDCLIGWNTIVRQLSRVNKYKAYVDDNNNSLVSEWSWTIKEALKSSVLSEKGTCILMLSVIALLAVIETIAIMLWVFYFKLLFTGQIQGVIEQLLAAIGK